MKVCLQKGGPEIGSPATIMDELRAATEVCQAGWEQPSAKSDTQNPLNQSAKSDTQRDISIESARMNNA